ncbi:MAG: IS66 family transposase [Terriglobales bacterium]
MPVYDGYIRKCTQIVPMWVQRCRSPQEGIGIHAFRLFTPHSPIAFIRRRSSTGAADAQNGSTATFGEYCNHTPLHRQSMILERDIGLEISRATLDGWGLKVPWLWAGIMLSP